MKYVLISAAHYKRSPYVEDYISHFQTNSTKFEVIYWDRTGLDSKDPVYKEKECFTRYSNGSESVRSNLIEYIKYAYFVSKSLKNNNLDRNTTLVIFSVQLQLFLWPLLKLMNIKNLYINDVRDYHFLSKTRLYKKVFNNSKMNIISSEGFREWLPNTSKIIVKHNTTSSKSDTEHIFDKKSLYNSFLKGEILIGHVGSLSHFDINSKLIKANSLDISFSFYGDGLMLNEYHTLAKNYKNMSVYGRYERYEEGEIYSKFHITNLLFETDSINGKTLMANRLYSSLLYLRPCVTLSGSYLSDQVSKYGLGIVISNIDNFNNEFKSKLFQFLENEDYHKNAKKYLAKVNVENSIFYDYFR